LLLQKSNEMWGSPTPRDMLCRYAGTDRAVLTALAVDWVASHQGAVDAGKHTRVAICLLLIEGAITSF